MLMTFNPAINGWAIFSEACRVMAKRLRDVCTCRKANRPGKAGRGCVVRDWRSGVSAERRHLKKSGKVCGGLPTRRYGAGESSATP
jgi:hypothetical protein